MIQLSKLVLCSGLLLALVACSERQVYDAIQDGKESECRHLPVDQQQRCFEGVSTVEYDEYKRELEKAKQDY